MYLIENIICVGLIIIIIIIIFFTIIFIFIYEKAA
jgi:hypothetical protein